MHPRHFLFLGPVSDEIKYRIRTILGGLIPLYIDFGLQTFSGTYYDKVKSISVPNELCEVILMDGDIEQNWQNWVSSKMSIIEPTLEEINASLIG